MASRYNQGAPPKPVDFIHAFVMEVHWDGSRACYLVITPSMASSWRHPPITLAITLVLSLTSHHPGPDPDP
jgi:hypothetical protein